MTKTQHSVFMILNRVNLKENCLGHKFPAWTSNSGGSPWGGCVALCVKTARILTAAWSPEYSASNPAPPSVPGRAVADAA